MPDYSIYRMKVLIGCLSLLIIPLTFYGQDPRVIMRQSQAKCQEIQSGYYEVIQYFKFIEHSDTMVNSVRCYFKKISDDIKDSAFAAFSGAELCHMLKNDTT